jgi:hypothetical protein
MVDVAFHPLFELDMGHLHFFSVLGRALFTAQHLEMNCRAIAGILCMREQAPQGGSSIIDNPLFRKEIQQLWKKTLGQHTHNLLRDSVFSEDFAPVLDAAVRARNEIAHHIAVDVTSSVDSKLDERISEIQDLVRQIAAADKVMSALIHILNGDPLPGKEFLDSYEDTVAAWVSEDTFED